MADENTHDHLKQAREDHDLMVRIDEKLKGLVIDMKDVKDNLNGRINNLESSIKTMQDKMVLTETAISSSRLVVKVVIGMAVAIIIPLLVYIWNMRSSNLDAKIASGIQEALSSYEINPQ